MHRHMLRWLGFAVPTVSVVTAAHLAAEPTSGEALDGVVSGLFFTLPFVATAWLRSRLEPRRPRARLRPPVWEVVLGLLAGAVTWALLWLGWTFPEMRGLRPHAFAINSVAMAAAGLLWPGPGRSGPDELEDPSTPGTPHTA